MVVLEYCNVKNHNDSNNIIISHNLRKNGCDFGGVPRSQEPSPEARAANPGDIHWAELAVPPDQRRYRRRMPASVARGLGLWVIGAGEFRGLVSATLSPEPQILDAPNPKLLKAVKLSRSPRPG